MSGGKSGNQVLGVPGKRDGRVPGEEGYLVRVVTGYQGYTNKSSGFAK